MTIRSKIKIDWLVLFGALLSTGAVSISLFGAAETPALVRSPAEIVLLILVIVVSLPFVYWMPRIQVGRFGQLAGWHVPARTYLLPRWVVRLCIGCVIGQLVGAILWALLKDPRILWLAGVVLISGVAFVAGAWQRMVGPRSAEFEISFPGVPRD
jgi:hypothetical protein